MGGRKRRTRKRKSKGKRWIQKAIKRPGALKRQLKRGLARVIVGATKRPVWTKSGEINTNTLKAFRKTQAYQRLSTKTKQRINLAIRLEGYSKNK